MGKRKGKKVATRRRLLGKKGDSKRCSQLTVTLHTGSQWNKLH